MEPLLVFAVPLALLWVLFIYPQQRRVRAHQRVVASLAVGDEVVLTAGIFGRVITLDDDELTLEVAPGVELRVARQAVLRRAGDDPAEADQLGGTATTDAGPEGDGPDRDASPSRGQGGPT